MTQQDPQALAAALAAEVNARQGTDYEPRAAKGGLADAVLAPKKGEGRSAALLVRRAALDAGSSPAASALAAKLAAKLKDKAGALTLLVSRAPTEKDADAWADAAAHVVASLEKAGGKAGTEFLTLDEPDAGSPFAYASWAPQKAGNLLVDLFFRSGAGKPAVKGDEDRWLVLLDEPAASGKTVGRAFSLDLPDGDAICRAWWAAPKGPTFTFRRF